MPSNRSPFTTAFRYAVALFAGGILLASSADAGLPFSGRKDRKARESLESGDLGAALASYQEILSSDIKDDRRQEALYNVALIYLQPDFEQRDVAEARKTLEELGAEGVGEQGPETRAILALAEELEQSREREDESRQLLEEKSAELAAATEKSEGEVADQKGKIDELQRKVRSLQSQLRAREKEIAEKDAELARKDAALERVTRTLVGGGGSGD